MGKVVFLCGMPGSGKSTLGKKLATKLNWSFCDLDEELKVQSGRSPAEWLREDGEAAFRKEEARVLRNLKSEPLMIVACGGGTPCFERNLQWMQENGTCIFIDLPLSGLVQRLSQKENVSQRPLLEGKDDLAKRLSELWNQREHYYRQINWWINGLQVDSGSLAREIGERT
jgi:shikimate kinase